MLTNTACYRVAMKFGGFPALAQAIGVTRTTPYGWNAPKTESRPHSGGGDIPHKYHKRILNEARDRRISIKPGDLVNA
jgi:hypothetical protein